MPLAEREQYRSLAKRFSKAELIMLKRYLPSNYGIKIGFPFRRHGQAGLSGIELTNHSYQVDRSTFFVVEAH